MSSISSASSSVAISQSNFNKKTTDGTATTWLSGHAVFGAALALVASASAYFLYRRFSANYNSKTVKSQSGLHSPKTKPQPLTPLISQAPVSNLAVVTSVLLPSVSSNVALDSTDASCSVQKRITSPLPPHNATSTMAPELPTVAPQVPHTHSHIGPSIGMARTSTPKRSATPATPSTVQLDKSMGQRELQGAKTPLAALDKELLLTILRSVHREMSKSFEPLRQSMINYTTEQREQAFAVLVQRVDSEVAIAHNVAETAIQDACEALENDDDIGRMLDLLSQLHDDLVPREDLPAAEQADEVDENGVTPTEKINLLGFVQESFNRTMTMLNDVEAMKLDGRLVDEANVEDYMTQQGELFQTELLAKYGFTLVTLQSKMAQAQADPEFANNLNELTVMMQQISQGTEVEV